MTLEDLGNLGDFVGGLAVIATLLYLAVQIRQSTRILRTFAEQTAETWQWQSRALRFYVAQPGVRTWWRKQGHALFAPESEFWAVVDSEMKKRGEPVV